jgi:two-component system, OmpR family, response regulator MprA
MATGEMAQRIVVTDDDAFAREGLRGLLTAWGYEVETAADGRQALERVAAVHPAAVITDVVMPVMNGLELLDALRTESPGMPVIVLTGHSSLDTLLVAIGEGVYAYLPKPVDVPKLRATLAGALAESKWETTTP